jgi:hypothetical protein
MSSNGLQDKEREGCEGHEGEVTEIVGSHQLLKIKRELTNFMCWWTEAMK